MNVDSDKQIGKADLIKVQAVLMSILLNLTCKWSGELIIEPIMSWGQKRASCEIVVENWLIRSGVRWTVYTHEMLHACSAGYDNILGYYGNIAWEEGTVEILERLLRPEIVSILNLNIDAKTDRLLQEYKRLNHYNRYVESIEKIATSLFPDLDAQRDFYINLLSIPLIRRSNWVMKKADDVTSALPVGERIRLLRSVGNECEKLYRMGRH